MKTRIRVLHVIGQLGVGGAEMQLLELCRRMDHSQFEPRVVCYSLSEDTLAPQFRAAGIEVLEFDKFSMPSWRFFLRLRKCVREFDPHIVHTWLYSANFWGRWAALSAGVRRLVSSDRAEFKASSALLRTYEWLLKRRTLRLANSEAIARSLERQLGIPAADVTVIRNAVELPEIRRDVAAKEIRTELKLSDTEKIVLMVGRQTWEKNYPMFVRAADIVCQDQADVTFVVVGREAGDGRIAEEVDRMANPNAVRFVGQRDDVYRWYAAADVFCLTSDTEGFPNVVLEAMWSQCPVICTDFPAAVEIMVDPSVGVIVPRDDAGALAGAIRSLLEDDNRRREMGVAAAVHVGKHYSWNALVESMQRIYADCATTAT